MGPSPIHGAQVQTARVGTPNIEPEHVNKAFILRGGLLATHQYFRSCLLPAPRP
jgi:hypothetical protein